MFLYFSAIVLGDVQHFTAEGYHYVLLWFPTQDSLHRWREMFPRNM